MTARQRFHNSQPTCAWRWALASSAGRWRRARCLVQTSSPAASAASKGRPPYIFGQFMLPEPLPGLGVVGAGVVGGAPVDGDAPVDGPTSGETLGDGDTA